MVLCDILVAYNHMGAGHYDPHCQHQKEKCEHSGRIRKLE